MRDGYEAFAMYCFGRYLVACLGTPLSDIISHSNVSIHILSLPYSYLCQVVKIGQLNF